MKRNCRLRSGRCALNEWRNTFYLCLAHTPRELPPILILNLRVFPSRTFFIPPRFIDGERRRGGEAATASADHWAICSIGSQAPLVSAPVLLLTGIRLPAVILDKIRRNTNLQYWVPGISSLQYSSYHWYLVVPGGNDIAR